MPNEDSVFSMMARSMRMDPGQGVGAAEWLNSADESDIADVIWRYGGNDGLAALPVRLLRHALYIQPSS